MISDSSSSLLKEISNFPFPDFDTFKLTGFPVSFFKSLLIFWCSNEGIVLFLAFGLTFL